MIHEKIRASAFPHMKTERQQKLMTALEKEERYGEDLSHKALTAEEVGAILNG
jgi:hypothetical protein